MFGLPPEAMEEIACVAVNEKGVASMVRKYRRDSWCIRYIAKMYSDYLKD